jgi:site-specific recombinase XerD
MASVKVYPRLDKVNVNNQVPVYLRLTKNRKSKYVALGVNIDPNDWNHSWAVRALQKGMRIEYVSKIMGHSSVKHTEIYARILNPELDKAMDVFDKIAEPENSI